MARKSWVLSDEFWAQAERLIPPPRRDPHKAYPRKPGGGRKRADDRLILSGIFYVLRTGCQWNAVPSQFGSSSTIHRRFLEWADAGYIGYDAWYLMIANGYQPCIQTQHHQRWLKKHDPDYVPRRWVVEVCHSWLNRFRKILVRFEKTVRAHYMLLCFACPHIVWRKVISR